MTTLPMFPLGSVLFPSVYLPLHVFEERYRALVEDCLAGDQEFGVVLIERGSEVGGGDTRSPVGTIARIIEAGRFDDGRWRLGTIGTRRIRVTRWLEDAPYPRADVEEWGEPPADPRVGEALDAVVPRLRRVLARRAELGDAVVAATVELSDDPVLASYQAGAVAPLGPADQYRLLAEPDARSRLEALAELLAAEDRDLDRLLALDSPEPDPGEPDGPAE